ncbi:MAG TPA: hypothetical protein VJ373_02255 [Desulfatiglandales bacterium]|nr:hypothetical protein [Desulfatiglandales bacterium]
MTGSKKDDKDNRAPYEPPRLFDLGGGVAYAQTVCRVGGSPGAVACTSGGTASGGQCKSGGTAAASCKTGTTATYGCKTGGKPWS